MTTPLSPPDADTSDAASPGAEKPRNPRKAPRRASAPAGAPASSPNVAPALLPLGPDGMVVPSPTTPLATDDAGHSPAADAAPSAVASEADAADGTVLDDGADKAGATDEASAAVDDTVVNGALDSEDDDASAVDDDTAEGSDIENVAVEGSSDADAEGDEVGSSDEDAEGDAISSEPASGDAAVAGGADASEAASNESPAGDPAEADEEPDAADSLAATQPRAEEPDVVTTVEADEAQGDVRAVATEGSQAEPEPKPISPDAADATAPQDDSKATEAAGEKAETADTAESTAPAAVHSDAGSETVSDIAGSAPANTASKVDDAAAATEGSAEALSTRADTDKEALESDAPGTPDASDATADADDVELPPVSELDADADADADNKDQDSAPAAESGSDSSPGDDEEPAFTDGPEIVDEKSGDASNEATTDAAPEEAQEAAPLSRRERRLAEQKAGPGVEHPEKSESDAEAKESNPSAATAAADRPDAAEPSATADMAKPAKKRKSISAMIKGLLVLLVIAVVVAATGTVLAGQKDDVVGPSNTEVNRQAAWERTTALLAQATELGKSASTPKLQEALGKTTADLAAQVIALGDGLPPNTAVASATAPATAATVAGLVLDLKASGSELLNSAATADQAMGRVFAAAGTSQLLQGLQLGSAIGSAPGASELSAARVDFPSSSGPQCSSTLEPRPGITVDSALLAAAHGEQKAVYAYQVATTRFAEPQFGKASEMLQRHQEKLDLLNAELTVRCLPLAVPVAGFALDPAFTSTPAPALAGLEAELGIIYADLAALSTPAADEESANAESPASAHPAAPAAASDSAVEKPLPQSSAVQSANNGLLREMSVAWLLDSSAAQLYWGGTVGALAGMKP